MDEDVYSFFNFKKFRHCLSISFNLNGAIFLFDSLAKPAVCEALPNGRTDGFSARNFRSRLISSFLASKPNGDNIYYKYLK